jgi:phosphatidylinositol alpha-mannosyltransferase
MLGFVDAREKATAFRAADLFAMPSAAESFGIVYIEAHYAGTPVLAAEIAAVREVLGDGGVLVPFGDVGAARDAIARLRDDPAHRGALATAGARNADRFRPAEALRRIGETIVAMAGGDQDFGVGV